MNLTSLFLTNLLSVSHFTPFFDHLITDGKYKSVLLVYNRASVSEADFVPELVSSAFGKYAVVIVNTEQAKTEYLRIKPYNQQFGV